MGFIGLNITLGGVKMKIKNVSLECYLKANTRYIKKNWKDAIIREKYDFSLGKYIVFHEHRIADIFSISIETPLLREWVSKMYKTA